MSLYEAIRYATGQGCDVIFFPAIGWAGIGVEARLRDKTGDVVKSAAGHVSHKELIAAYCPEAVMEHRLRTATEKVLDDSRLD